MTTRSIRHVVELGVAVGLSLACRPQAGDRVAAPEARAPVTQAVVDTRPPPLPLLPDVAAPLATEKDGVQDAAILVGIETYDFDLPSIPGAVANAEAWKRYLLAVRGVPAERLLLLTDRNATDDAIRRALDELAPKVGKKGRLWFLFIGHGAPGPRNEGGLLVGADAKAQAASLRDRSVSQEELVEKLATMRGQAIVVLDACFSGRTTSGEWLLKGVQPSIPLEEEQRPQRVKARVPMRVLVLSAATSEQYAGRLADHPRPAFSYLLLGAMRGWADRDRDAVVTADEAIDYTRDVLSVVLNQTRTQTPVRTGSGETTLASASEADPGVIGILTQTDRVGTAPLGSDCSRTHFGPLWPPLIPPSDDFARAKSQSAGSIQSDIAFATARSAQAEWRTDPDRAHQAWCALEKIAKDNPHQWIARSLCSEWREFNQGVAWFANDHRCIELLLQGRAYLHDTTVQRHVANFCLRYGELTWRSEILDLQARSPACVQETSVNIKQTGRTYLDREPVRKQAYELCVQAGACRVGAVDQCHRDAANPSESSNSATKTCVSPLQAREYCAWLGKRLPSAELVETLYAKGRPDNVRHFLTEVSDGTRTIAFSLDTGRGPSVAPSERWSHVGFHCAREVPAASQP